MTVPLTGRGRQPRADAMTITEHLGELRRRLMIAILAFVVGACVAAIFYNWSLRLLQQPYCHAVGAQTAGGDVFGIHAIAQHALRRTACQFYVTQPLDGLSLRIKLAAFGGLILSSPVVLFELWRFITPGLKPTERRYAIPFVLSSIVLFLGGCATAYFIFPRALRWLIGVGGPDLTTLLNPNSYLSLILLLMLMFGLTYEFPVVLVALQLVRVVTPAALLRHWRWAVIGITVASAVFTPSSDPFSMLAMAVPLVAFYFIAIGIGKLLKR